MKPPRPKDSLGREPVEGQLDIYECIEIAQQEEEQRREKDMGEFAEYRGERINIGTCEEMYYLRFDQRMMVRAVEGSVDPVTDELGIRFRFPFPDEDDIEPGQFDDYNRGLPVPGYNVPPDWMGDQPQTGDVEIVQQKVVAEGDTKSLWTVIRVPDGSTHGHLIRLPLYEAAKLAKLLAGEAAYGISGTNDEVSRSMMLVKVAARMLAGYTAMSVIVNEPAAR